MNREAHKKRHIMLHKALDQLLADYMYHHPKQIKITSMPIIKLMQWSNGQCLNPTEEK